MQSAGTLPPLAGMQIVELAAFIAAPSCTLQLAQLGADVIRIDPIGGGVDQRRWPLNAAGTSLYWEGLNKQKRSVALDLAHPEGQAIARALITRPGPDAGFLVTNFPATGVLEPTALATLRRDLVTLRLEGWSDGRTAVDYTVNAACGVPLMTGPAESAVPVNHILPAWDLLAGSQAALALMAAARHRAATGEGQEVRIALADVAMASLGHLGQIAEATVGDGDRPKIGNDLFGAFGRDFELGDGSRVMIVAITPRQWRALLSCLGVGAAVAQLERELGVDFLKDEGARFIHRSRLLPIFEVALAEFDLDSLHGRLDGTGVCWSPYRTVREAVAPSAEFAMGNPVFETLDHPGGRYLTPGTAARLPASPGVRPRPAPVPGADTESVLKETLGLTAARIASLREKGVIGAAP